MKRVEGPEEFLLRLLLARDELNVVDQVDKAGRFFGVNTGCRYNRFIQQQIFGILAVVCLLRDGCQQRCCQIICLLVWVTVKSSSVKLSIITFSSSSCMA